MPGEEEQNPSQAVAEPTAAPSESEAPKESAPPEPAPSSESIAVEEQASVGEGVFFDLEEFIKRLKKKPHPPPLRPEGCGTAGPTYRNIKFPAADRLTVATWTNLDSVKQITPYPKLYIPPRALPAWHFRPIERKLPLVPAPKGLLYFTRGHMGQKLHRESDVYSVIDPLNLERVVGGPYNSLHDLHARAFLYIPQIRALLLERGFINELNEVICSIQEFNKFREYLRTLYADELWKQFNRSDSFEKQERQQMFALIKSEHHNMDHEIRVENFKRYTAETEEYKRKKAENRDQLAQSRFKQFLVDKETKCIEHILNKLEKQKKIAARLESLATMNMQRKRNILNKSTRKQLEAEERKVEERERMREAQESFLWDWIQAKSVFCYEKMLENRQLQTDLTGSLKYRAMVRQKRLERYREMMPSLIAKRKAEKERLWGIVRKFAMRWLAKVRAKMNAPKDGKHESCWIGGTRNVLDETVKYLYQESGYEKLDDFIMNIMKLKEQIKHQIEKEEAEEAAAEAEAAEGGGGGAPSQPVAQEAAPAPPPPPDNK